LESARAPIRATTPDPSGKHQPKHEARIRISTMKAKKKAAAKKAPAAKKPAAKKKAKK
jgi:hypothetical protein